MIRTKVKDLHMDSLGAPPQEETQCALLVHSLTVQKCEIHKFTVVLTTVNPLTVQAKQSWCRIRKNYHGKGLFKRRQEREIIVYTEKRNKRTSIICVIHDFITHNFNK